MNKRLPLPIEDLLLDFENPRIGSVRSQPEALQALIEFDPRHFRTMMESIKQHGLDPGDLFYVVKEPDPEGNEGYIVVDGNRRLAALKILLEPALLVGAGVPDSTEKFLRKAADGFDIESVEVERLCVLFDSRSEADDWIVRRHGRGQAGEGRIPWGPLEIQRFQGDRSVLDVIEFVARNAPYTPERWSEVRSKLERRSYVLRRFLESKAGREALGLGEVEAGEATIPTTDRDPSKVLRILMKLFEDIESRDVNTRTYNKAKEILGYFQELPGDLVYDPEETKRSATPFRDIKLREQAPTPGPPSSKPRQTRPTGLRTTLAPKQFEFKQPVNAKGQQLLREASKIRLKEMPLGAAFLLRGFIGFVVDTYMTDNGLPFREGSKQLELHVRAERVIDHLIKNKRAKRMDLSGIRRRLAQTSKQNPASIQALNDYHHDRYQVPDPDSLRTGWDEASALFAAVLGRP